MTGPLTTKLRLVRCPRCRRVLPELPNIPVYKCGGCNIALQAKKRKNDSEDTNLRVPDTDIGKKNDLEHDSEDKEARSLSKEDKQARSLSKEETLSSTGEIPLEKNNGSGEREDKNSNMNQSGNTRYGNEESSPPEAREEAEVDQDECSLKRKNGGDPNEYVQCNGKQNGGVNFSDEVASPTKPNHRKSEEEENGGVNFSDEVASSTDYHPDSEESSLVAGAHSEVDENRNCLEQDSRRNQNEYVQCKGKQNGGVNFSDEVASPTKPNHLRSEEEENGGVNFSDEVASSTDYHPDSDELVTGAHSEVDENRNCLGQDSGRNQNEHGICNGKQNGGVNFSDEVASPTKPNHHKSEEEENGGVKFSDEVASSTDYHHDSEESSPVAGAHSEVDENKNCSGQDSGKNQNEYGICNWKQTGGVNFSDEVASSTELNDNEIKESLPVVRVHTEANEFSGEVSFTRYWPSNTKFSGEVSLSTELTCQEIVEPAPVIQINGKLDENSRSPMSVDQSPKRKVTGFNHIGSVETLENVAEANYSSELSVTHRDMPNFPTTSNFGYEGSVSSYDGNDDQVSDRYLHPFKRKGKEAYSPIAKAMHKRDEVMNRMTSYPEMEEHQSWNYSSIPSEKKHSMTKGKWRRDELMEHTRHGPAVRGRMKVESGGYRSRVPLYSRGSQVGYETGGPSHYRQEEFQSRKSLHSPNKREKNPDEEKVELLKMVFELQDQLKRTRISKGIALEEEMYPRRSNQGKRLPCQNQTSRIPFSAEANISRYTKMEPHSCYRCCPHDRQSSAPLPPHVFCNKSQQYKAHQSPRRCNLYSSTPSSPQYYTSSEFSLQSYDPVCDDRELMKHYRERMRLKRHIRPLAGGAPFVICYLCSELLQLPLDFLLSKRRFHKLRCSACSNVLKFSLEDGTCIYPYTDDYTLDAIAPPPSEVDDYGPSLGKSCSTEVEPYPVGIPFQAIKKDSYGRKMSSGSSFEPMGEKTRGPTFKGSENKKKKSVEMFAAGPSSKLSKAAGKTSSEIEEFRPAPGSPLHKLMGYTSASEVMDR